MQHIKTKKRTVHARPMTVLSPGDLARAVGGGIIVHDATGGDRPRRHRDHRATVVTLAPRPDGSRLFRTVRAPSFCFSMPIFALGLESRTSRANTPIADATPVWPTISLSKNFGSAVVGCRRSLPYSLPATVGEDRESNHSRCISLSSIPDRRRDREVPITLFCMDRTARVPDRRRRPTTGHAAASPRGPAQPCVALSTENPDLRQFPTCAPARRSQRGCSAPLREAPYTSTLR